eukprot:jgi/Undpi1/12119/HiC_scaffold_5.g01795.m1
MRAFLAAFTVAFLATLASCFSTSKEITPQRQYDETTRTSPVNVYVYEDPEFDQTQLLQCHHDRNNRGPAPWQNEKGSGVQDMAEVWLHQSILSHPWRVLDPKEADVFLIPLYPVFGAKLGRQGRKCGGLSHQQRTTRALTHLVKTSPYFNRFGGADHVIVCSWWNCGRAALQPEHRMLLRRAVVGINEQIDLWSMWGCRNRMVTVPYTANSALTTSTIIGGLGQEARTIPFFFVGTSRARPERDNLQVVKQLSPNSVIEIGENEHKWSEGAGSYAYLMSRSRFCFCPRGDTISSRRIYDAIAAGCIPVITTTEVEALPFRGTGLDYSEFSVIAAEGSLSTVEGVKALVKDLSSRSDEQLAPLREGLARGRSSTIYGMTSGPALADMTPFHDTASRFLEEVHNMSASENKWNCPSSEISESMLSPRTQATFPPTGKSRNLWLHQSETIVNVEHSLLFCAPPNTGSLQFRMLAKRIKGVDHWQVSNVPSLLFDVVESKLPVLDLSNAPLMNKIYKDNGSGWIKIGVVRDPVTRLLSAYLDLVQTWQNIENKSPTDIYGQHQPHRGLSIADTLEWFDIIRRHRDLKGDETKQHIESRGKEHIISRSLVKDNDDRGESDEASRRLQEAAGRKIPTFKELLDVLDVHLWKAPLAFRPVSGQCGMGLSSFDTIIPFETLQETSTMVFKSLPGDIWRNFGQSGWGPHGKHAFMEFDYGTVARHYPYVEINTDGLVSNKAIEPDLPEYEEGQNNAAPTISPRAQELFSDGSCGWAEFYTDLKMLDSVGRLYGDDYELFGWYDLQPWRERLELCLH